MLINVPLRRRAYEVLAKLEQTVLGMRAKTFPGMCPRGTVGAALLSARGDVLANGFTHVSPAPCTCNQDQTPTELGASSTCKSTHAEIAAFDGLTIRDHKHALLIVTTRPPCQRCIECLTLTPIRCIVTSNFYEDRDNARDVWLRHSALATWFVFPTVLGRFKKPAPVIYR